MAASSREIKRKTTNRKNSTEQRNGKYETDSYIVITHANKKKKQNTDLLSNGRRRKEREETRVQEGLIMKIYGRINSQHIFFLV